jgi:hypothetical protein
MARHFNVNDATLGTSSRSSPTPTIPAMKLYLLFVVGLLGSGSARRDGVLRRRRYERHRSVLPAELGTGTDERRVPDALPSRAYVTYSAPISMSQVANPATTVVFQAGTLGAAFSGTIWFDDIKIQ